MLLKVSLDSLATFFYSQRSHTQLKNHNLFNKPIPTTSTYTSTSSLIQICHLRELCSLTQTYICSESLSSVTRFQKQEEENFWCQRKSEQLLKWLGPLPILSFCNSLNQSQLVQLHLPYPFSYLSTKNLPVQIINLYSTHVCIQQGYRRKEYKFCYFSFLPPANFFSQ